MTERKLDGKVALITGGHADWDEDTPCGSPPSVPISQL